MYIEGPFELMYSAALTTRSVSGDNVVFNMKGAFHAIQTSSADSCCVICDVGVVQLYRTTCTTIHSTSKVTSLVVEEYTRCGVQGVCEATGA